MQILSFSEFELKITGLNFLFKPYFENHKCIFSSALKLQFIHSQTMDIADSAIHGAREGQSFVLKI
jgi:hypothetical protein